MDYYGTQQMGGRTVHPGFGPKRDYRDPIATIQNIAAALQARMEDVVLGMLRRARDHWKMDKLCLAGGVALNCSMNGKIERAGIFDEIFVNPPVAIGALAWVHAFWHTKPELGMWTCAATQLYLALDGPMQTSFQPPKVVTLCFTNPTTFQIGARQLAAGRIVGWFQGRSSWTGIG